VADFNQVGNPQLAGGIGRLYGVNFPSLSVISSEISITTSPWERPEFWALLGGGLGVANVEAAAPGAGNFAAAALHNPTGSGVLLIAEWVTFHNTGGGTRRIRYGLKRTALTGSTGAWVNRDWRRMSTTGGGGGLACRLLTETGVGAAVTGNNI